MSAAADEQSARYSREAARWRRKLRVTEAALEDANRTLLTMYLRDRLIDPSDFYLHNDPARLVDQDGRIVWPRVQMLVDELVRAKPHLATPKGRDAATRDERAVSWLTTEM